MATLFDEHPEMNDDFASFVFAAKKAQSFLTELLQPASRGHEFAVLCRSWKRSVEEGSYVSKPDQVAFQVFEGADPSVTLCAVIKPNKYEGAQSWALTYAGKDSFSTLAGVAVSDAAEAPVEDTVQEQAVEPEPQPEPQPEQAPAPAAPKNAPMTNARDLKDYAFIWMGPGSTFFKELAALAQPEAWGFSEGDYSVLYSYIVQTFYKLRRDGLVLENEERTFAAMNTGLVTPRYEDIYLCFKPNTKAGHQPWCYAGVCTQYDNRDKGKALSTTLRNTFREMPKRATFFSDVSDIVFDATKDVVCNWDHIIVENIDRIPTDFIANQLYDKQAAEIRELVESIDYDPDHGTIQDPFGDHATGSAGAQFDELRSFLQSSPMHFNRIKSAMEGALDRAIKRAEYSFRTGVPSFYPTINKVQILLPLGLVDEDQPDCALVAAKDRWGNYEGKTILTLRMAYNNARLLCRPESEWLKVG